MSEWKGMKMKSEKIVLIFIISIILLSSGLISQESKYRINPDGTYSEDSGNIHSLTDLGKDDPKQPEFNQNFNELWTYATNVLPRQNTEIRYHPNAKTIALYDKDGKEILNIPYGVSFKFIDGKPKFSGSSQEVKVGDQKVEEEYETTNPVTGQSEKKVRVVDRDIKERNLIKFKGHTIDISNGLEVTVEEIDGKIVITTNGRGDLTINGNSLKGITKGVFRIDNKG